MFILKNHRNFSFILIGPVVSLVLLFYYLNHEATTSQQQRRANAVVIALVRNSDLVELLRTLSEFEYVFNSRFKYPYVFLNDVPFDDTFKEKVTQFLAKRRPDGSSLDQIVSFGLVPKEHWSHPSWIDLAKANQTRQAMAAKGIQYGGVESYRHMCRFYSGFFYRHPLLQQFNYYWRIEPGANYQCKIDYDPFLFMAANNKLYGFVEMMHEPQWQDTVGTLWKTTKDYAIEVYSRKHQAKKKRKSASLLKFFLAGKSRRTFITKLLNNSTTGDLETFEASNGIHWTTCHFWNNFEIASFRFFRSPLYESYFEYLDKAGGFYYERWGDAPVHSLAVGLFLDKSQIHHFRDFGYVHDTYSWCPVERSTANKCFCNVNHKFNTAGFDERWCGTKFLHDLKNELEIK